MIIWMLSWMFQHDYLDTCCFECLICMCFVFSYLHLFSATEHVSHGKVLKKYAHYYYCCFVFVVVVIIIPLSCLYTCIEAEWNITFYA